MQDTVLESHEQRFFVQLAAMCRTLVDFCKKARYGSAGIESSQNVN